jgi:DNA-directed RNA polymerase subunit RPC12/RpoP
MIKFRCPNCQTKLGVPDEYAGHRIRCNKCSQPTVVPKPQPVQIEPPHSPGPQESELLDLLNDQMAKIQEDPNAALLRQARQDKLAKEKIKLSPHNAAKDSPNPTMHPGESNLSSF